MRRETATTAAAHRVGAMTWDAVAARLGAGTAAILPVGAGAKQHGRHLPMESDLIQADWLADALAARIDALVWPTLAYGHYPAFAAYAGSCSLSADLFAALVGEVLEGLSAYGPAGIIILDTGISTNAPIARAVVGIDAADRVLHLPVYRGPGLLAAAARLATQPHGSHADEIETSIMLALAPDRVAMARAEASPAKPPGPGPMQHADPRAPNFSASGSIGDPTSATEAKGRALLAAMVEDMSAAVARWRPSAIR